jgi:hypothetical protein
VKGRWVLAVRVAVGVVVIAGATSLLGVWPLQQPAPPVNVIASPSIQVPQFVGLPSGDARTTAETVGLKVAMTDGAAADVPFIDGVVVDQTPKHQALAAHGDVVRLTVSGVTVAAPTLVGLNLAEALRALELRRLKLGKTVSRFVPDAKRSGTIITQQPLPGATVAAGTEVDVVVSREAQLSDFRVGIYFVESSGEAEKAAGQVRDLVRKSGGEAVLSPRPEQFFTGAYKPKQPLEIRYGSEPERLAGQELQRLLKSAGGFSNVELTPVRMTTEGFLSVFILAPAAKK